MRVFARIMIVFFALLFLGAIGWLGVLLLQDNADKQAMDDLRAMVGTQEIAVPDAPANTPAAELPPADGGDAAEQPAPTPVPEPPEVLPEYQALYNANPDFAGWIKIEGTVIDYPVVYTPDNPEKYLYMLFNGEKSSAGVPLIGAGASLFPQSDTITVYSHNRRNGTMFAMLAKYEDPAFYEEHKQVQFDTRYERGTYEVFAVCHAKYDKNAPEDYFQYYAYPTLPTEEAYDEYVGMIQSMALYDTGIVPAFGEKLLLLSTCGYFAENGRIVVVARRVG